MWSVGHRHVHVDALAAQKSCVCKCYTSWRVCKHNFFGWFWLLLQDIAVQSLTIFLVSKNCLL